MALIACAPAHPTYPAHPPPRLRLPRPSPTLQVYLRLQWQTEVVRGASVKLEVDMAGVGLMVMGGLQVRGTPLRPLCMLRVLRCSAVCTLACTGVVGLWFSFLGLTQLRPRLPPTCLLRKPAPNPQLSAPCPPRPLRTSCST